jgi:rhodanese-related sulfurtransferase
MIDYLVNSNLVLLALCLLVLGALVWHWLEMRWDKKTFYQNKEGIFANLHVRKALYVFDHVDGLVPVDVRSRKEFDESHIPGAVNAAYDDKDIDRTELEELSRDTPLLLYCEGGFHSRCSIDPLKKMGFRTIYHLHRGYQSWKLFGGAVESSS